MKKGGISGEAIIILILGAIFLIGALIFVETQSAQASEREISRQKCAATVDRMSFYEHVGLSLSERSLNCPTVTVPIKDKDDEKNKKLMADAMFQCASQFKQGERRLFDEDGTYCNVCYIFDIQTDKPIKGFEEYLLTTEVPGSSGQKYFDYMQGSKSDEADKLLGQLDNPVFLEDSIDGKDVESREIGKAVKGKVLEPGKQYATIFIYARGVDEWEKVWRHLTLQTDAGKVGAAGGGLAFVQVAAPVAGGVVAKAAVGAIITGSFAIGPVGWVVIGGGLIAGAALFARTEWVTYQLSPDAVPEYASFFVFRDWNRETTPQELTGPLGCEVFT